MGTLERIARARQQARQDPGRYAQAKLVSKPRLYHSAELKRLVTIPIKEERALR